MADREMAEQQNLLQQVEDKVILLTPEQLVDIAKKLGVRGVARGTRSHLSLLRAVSEILEKYCEEAGALEVLTSMLKDLNVLLDPEEPEEEEGGSTADKIRPVRHGSGTAIMSNI